LCLRNWFEILSFHQDRFCPPKANAMDVTCKEQCIAFFHYRIRYLNGTLNYLMLIVFPDCSHSANYSNSQNTARTDSGKLWPHINSDKTNSHSIKIFPNPVDDQHPSEQVEPANNQIIKIFYHFCFWIILEKFFRLKFFFAEIWRTIWWVLSEFFWNNF
jgi:hypothetical protein